MPKHHTRRTDPDEIADVLFWALMKDEPLHVECRDGKTLEHTFVRRLVSNSTIVHLGTRKTTMAVVHVCEIAAVTA